MINPLANSPQFAASGSFLLGNTGLLSGSYLIGQGLVLPSAVKRTKVDTFVLVKLFLLLPHAGAIEEKPFKTMT
jgi:hypothetical protein